MKKIFFHLLVVGLTSTQVYAQLPNSGFETWTNMGSYENPDGWATLNDYTSTSGIYTATKGTPGSPGSSFLKLTSQTIGLGVLNGIAVSGTINAATQQAESGFAFSQQPTSFNGKWQHMIFGSSQGSINVSLTRWDATTSSRIVVATANKTLTGMAMNWANFSIPFVYTDSQAPDSCIIVMKASGANPTQDDYLWVDNLSFVGNVAGIVENSSTVSELKLFPNPVDDQLAISFNSSTNDNLEFEIFSLSGAVLLKQNATVVLGLNTIPIDLSGLPAGNYLISFGNLDFKSVLPVTVR